MNEYERISTKSKLLEKMKEKKEAKQFKNSLAAVKKYYVNKQNLHANEEFSAQSSQKCTTQECFCFESEKIGI